VWAAPRDTRCAVVKPPVDKRGYNSNEVDAFLALVGIELNRR
jgi:DivIVA domain-containing protein